MRVLASDAVPPLVDTATGVTTATRTTAVPATTMTLMQILALAMRLCHSPLVVRALIDRMRAGMEKQRQMTDPPHTIRVHRENTRAHTAVLEWSSVREDTGEGTAVGSDSTTCTMVALLAAGCGWKLYAS